MIQENEAGSSEDAEVESNEEIVAHHQTTADEQTDVNDVTHPQDVETTSDKKASETVVSEQADKPSTDNKMKKMNEVLMIPPIRP
eukprot:Seg4608.3 transcript_id=Seg4608.3/GoldUCD/mRNA.D3Y31 product="hypothetical protein" pseudo=true protein_id=Seg4608.3/GoldUCD/D3Y31